MRYVISSGIEKCRVAAERKNCSGKTEIYYCWFSATDGDQTKHPAIFDHVNLNNTYVTLNSDRYPADDYNFSFANLNFLGLMVMQPCLELNSLAWMN